MTRVHAALLFAVAISTCSSLHAVVPSRCSRIVASADPSPGPPRRVAIVVDGKQSQTQLVAAILGAQQKKKKITRSVGYDRLLNDIRADPVPLMIAAAAVAAAGPSPSSGSFSPARKVVAVIPSTASSPVRMAIALSRSSRTVAVVAVLGMRASCLEISNPAIAERG